MSVVIKTIKDYFNNYVYPKTKTKAVYDDSNNRLDTTLSTVVHFDNDSSSGTISDPVLKQSDIATSLGTSDTVPASQKLVNTVNTNLGSPSSASSVTGADAFSKISTLNSELTEQVGSITPKTGYTLAAGMHRKVSHICEVDITFSGVTVDSSQVDHWVYCADISIVPEVNIYFTWYNGSTGTIFCEGYIDTSGKVYFRPEEVASSIYLSTHAMYITAS